MANRKSHVPKTPQERRHYLDQMSSGGTNEQIDISSSGASTASLPAQPIVRSSGARPKDFDFSKWWQKWKSEALVSAVGAILMSIGGCVYTLNREVGEGRRDIDSLGKRFESIEKLDLGVISFKVDELWKRSTDKVKSK